MDFVVVLDPPVDDTDNALRAIEDRMSFQRIAEELSKSERTSSKLGGLFTFGAMLMKENAGEMNTNLGQEGGGEPQ